MLVSLQQTAMVCIDFLLNKKLCAVQYTAQYIYVNIGIRKKMISSSVFLKACFQYDLANYNSVNFCFGHKKIPLTKITKKKVAQTRIVWLEILSKTSYCSYHGKHEKKEI